MNADWIVATEPIVRGRAACDFGEVIGWLERDPCQLPAEASIKLNGHLYGNACKFHKEGAEAKAREI